MLPRTWARSQKLLQAFAWWQSRDVSVAKRKDSERNTLAVKDFGPIAEATVELRPFTVFVGASNTGKSYLAILLYALHRFFGRRDPTNGWHIPGADTAASTEQIEKTIRTLLTQVLSPRDSKRSTDVELPEHVAALVRPIMEDVNDAAPRARCRDRTVLWSRNPVSDPTVRRHILSDRAALSARQGLGERAESQLPLHHHPVPTTAHGIDPA